MSADSDLLSISFSGSLFSLLFSISVNPDIINDRIKFIAVDCKEIKSLGNTDLGVNIPDRLERICKCGHEDARHDSNCNDCSCKEFRKREYDIRILSA